MDRIEKYRTFSASFKRQPGKEYLNNLYLYIIRQEKPTDEQYDLLLRHLLETCKSFPTIHDVRQSMLTIKKNMAPKAVKSSPSIDLPHEKKETPAWLEAILLLIKQGKHDTDTFRYATRRLTLTEDELWSMFELWTEGLSISHLIEKAKKTKGQ